MFYKYTNYKLITRIILSLILSLFIVLGSKSMQDFSGYVDFYNDIDSFDTKYSGLRILERQIALIATSSGGFEPGYIYLNRLFYDSGFTALQFLTIITFITNFLLLNFLSKYPRFTFSLFFFISTQLFFQQGNLVRQMLAISILLSSISFINNRKFSYFFILVILASTIHIGSLIFLISYFLTQLNLKKYYLFFVWLFTVVTFYHPNIFPLNTEKFGIFFTKELTRSESIGDLVYFNYVYNAVLLIFILGYDNISIKNEYKTLFIIFYIGICLGNLVSITEWFYRISLYFLPPLIILLSQIDIPIRSLLKLNIKATNLIIFGILSIFLITYPIRFSIFPNTTAIGKEIFLFSEYFNF